MKKVNLK